MVALPPDDPPRVMALLAATGLFDATHYLAAYADVRGNGAEPLAHFCRFGWREGRNPNPCFETVWYLRDNPDVATAGGNPLQHYAERGEAKGRRPCARFDPAWYRRFAGLGVRVSPLAHFLARHGGHAPPPARFDAAAYLERYPDVAAAGVAAFSHYVLDGAAEGRSPGAATEAAIIAASDLFDPSHYLIGSPDVGEAGQDPLAHFCAFGWREGRRPNPYFDPRWYRGTHLAGLRGELNPLLHYVLSGETADLCPAPYFDPGWYRRTYRLRAGVSPLRHYLRHRRSQTFSPSPHFDHAFYLRANAETIGPNRDPFAHYLVHGALRDIDPSPRFDAGAYRRAHMAPPGQTPGASIEDDNPLVHFLRQRANAPPVPA